MVFVLDKKTKPLMPTTEAHARKLLEKGRARVHKYTPFVIRLTDVEANMVETAPVHLKLDPGTTKTGFALLCGNKVLMLGEITHKTIYQIKKKLDSRRSLRRGRRSRKTRYRAPRFDNRKKIKGKLAPSIRAWLDQILHFVAMMKRYTPLAKITYEYANFDPRLMEDNDIEGVEYQRGPLYGIQLRHYILAKYEHQCVYCGARDVPLELDHLIPKSKGGSDRIGNLAPACRKCNQEKGTMTPEEYFASWKGARKKTAADRLKKFNKLRAKTPASMSAAAHMNVIKDQLLTTLVNKYKDISIKTGDGGVTHYNRLLLGLEKEHYYDALCVCGVPDDLELNVSVFQDFQYKGRGTRKRVQPDSHGFPDKYRQRKRVHFGFMTGDLVKVKDSGIVGRVTVRAKGGFTITPNDGSDSFSKTWRKVKLLQRGNGWFVCSKRISKDDSVSPPA